MYSHKIDFMSEFSESLRVVIVLCLTINRHDDWMSVVLLSIHLERTEPILSLTSSLPIKLAIRMHIYSDLVNWHTIGICL